MTIPAVVIGSDITALGTLRSLVKKNIKVFLDCAESDATRYSKYYKHADFLKNNRTQVDFEALAKLPYKELVLIPCSDRFVQQLSNIPEKFNQRLLVSSCSEEALSTLVYKDKFANQIRKTKISAPKTYELDSSRVLDDFTESEFKNMFLKPISSAQFIRKYGVKALRVNSKSDAINKYKEMSDDGFQVVLQEYIPGPASSHYFIDGFVDRKGEMKALFARRRYRSHPVDFGNSCYMRSVPLKSVANAITDIKVLFGSIGYRGIFSAEFKMDESEQALKIIEVNARCWWYVSFATSCGVNMPWLAYEDALQQDIVPIDGYPEGRRCVFPYCDLKSYREKTNKDASFVSMVVSWIGANQPVFCWSDPMPAIVSSFRIVRAFLKKTMIGSS